MNTFGNILRLTSFGESHGPAIGGVIDGYPSGIIIDFEAIRREMSRRRPGGDPLTSPRKEDDEVEFLSGIYKGVSLGTPIGFIIRNKDVRSEDYQQLEHTFRPGHADYTYQAKYGIRDYRGGGRASARETAVRVVAGAICKQALFSKGIVITTSITQIGNATDDDMMKEEIESARASADSVGGIVSCRISGIPVGLGEPVYGKFQSLLASAMLSINAVKGFDYGSGFENASKHGTELLDKPLSFDSAGLHTFENVSGGILGGITTGEEINFRVVFKPVATLRRPVETINDKSEKITIEVSGRHDTCVVPRAVPVVEAMAAIVTLDALLLSRTSSWR